MSATALNEKVVGVDFEGVPMSPREIHIARCAFVDGQANDFVPLSERAEYVAERYPLPRTSKPREEPDEFGDWKYEHGQLWYRRRHSQQWEPQALGVANDGNREAISKVLADPVVYVEVGE